MADLNAFLSSLQDNPLLMQGLATMAASGYSDHPVSLGQALAGGVSGGNNLINSSTAAQFQRIALARNLAYLKALQNGVPQGSPQGQQGPVAPSSPEADVSPDPQIIPDNQIGAGNPLTLSGVAQSQPSNPLMQQPNAYGSIMNDPELAYDVDLSKAAPDAATQTAWLTRARLRYDMLSQSPQYEAEQAGAKAQAEFPFQATENYLRYAGAPKELQPGVPAVAGGAFLPPWLQGVLGFTPGNAPTFQNRGGNAVQTSAGKQGSPSWFGGSTINGFPVIQGPSISDYNFGKGQGDAATKYWEDLSSKADAAQTQNNIIDNMRGDFSSFTPSKTAAYRGKAQEWLNALGFPVDQNSVGSYESSNKLGVQLQSAMTKTLGSREAAQVFTVMGSAVPNNTLAPNGFERVADFMQGAGDYQLAKKQYAQQFADKGDSKGMNSVDATFQKYSDPSFFIIARANPQQQAQFIQEMGSKAKAQAFLARWQNAYKMGLAPAVP